MAFKPARLAVALAVLAAGPALAQNIAVVNGTPIPTSRANTLVNEMKRQGQPDSPELQQQIRDELINREILAQEAVRKGLAAQPDVRNEMALAQQAVLVRALLSDFMNNSPISDAEVQARYDTIKKQYGDKEYHARHILVPTEEEADKLIAQLKAGANFADLAKKYSQDPGSAPNGGDLDWSAANAYVPEFANALVKLKKGQYTETPVKSSFGWHIIELDDVRDTKIPPLADVKPQIVKQLREEKLQAYETALRNKAKIQ